MKHLIFLILLIFIVGCASKNPVVIQSDPSFIVTPMKWYQNHLAAITINYDAGIIDNRTVINEVRNRKLRMDFEMVTEYYARPENRYIVEIIKNELIPSGIHVFGHGHKHVLHDTLSEDSAYASFKKCYDLMDQWGLHPKAYAYPACSGTLERTQRANRRAGFICARGGTFVENEFYICADDEIEPLNWYFLPSVMIAYPAAPCVHTHAEISAILDKSQVNRSWIILMYHSIGNKAMPDYYPLEEFIQDLDYLRNNDFWVANMESVALYIKERNAFHANCQQDSSGADGSRYTITFSDSRDNDTFNQPLTVRITIVSEKSFTRCRFFPPVVSGTEFNLTDNNVLVDVLPDERSYNIEFF